MSETLAERADFEDINEEIDESILFRSLDFFEDKTGFGLGDEHPGKLEIIVEYTGKESVMPVPEDVLKEKFESYENIINYIEDLTKKEATSEADKVENEEFFPYVKAAEPEKYTLQLVEEQKENLGRCIFLIEGNLVPLNEENGFELMLVFCWESQNSNQEINRLREISLGN